ncbi:MAG TPA: zinc-dependent peptidase [Parafilimonas sp.]|nr:zinc-dependent peptidase [Parafilimonas sp.]
MADTLIISDTDSIQSILDSLPPEARDIILKEINNTEQHNDPLLRILIVLSGIVAFLIIAFKTYKKTYTDKNNEDDNSNRNVPLTEPGFYYYKGENLDLTDADIITILQKHFTYYSCLSAALKDKFSLRLKQFMEVKTFRLPKDETFREVPVLLSAAAVQLTFGLAEFELPWFQNIHIHAEEYFADDPAALRLLQGNVEGNTITVAWNHFLKGLNNYEDGANVGLHEMAHALYYQYVIAEKNSDKIFRNAFDAVMREGNIIYGSGKNAQTLFSEYAFKNIQEFWAESIELFFERTANMQHEFPFLFNSIATLLNQNPLHTSNPVSEKYIC